ncbi:hypothetical protein ARMSODRAFT_1007307 [Armillaria solidipes]|uniref:F-box domain-containing protein n=1 Tax=Armillaria solidipes TaxID=1076256 RepID=A0A2H3BK39_9AGAR|nr:hypothetical protein ARMSODRAFT_1007307 [Armillaria solidipes]
MPKKSIAEIHSEWNPLLKDCGTSETLRNRKGGIARWFSLLSSRVHVHFRSPAKTSVSTLHFTALNLKLPYSLMPFPPQDDESEREAIITSILRKKRPLLDTDDILVEIFRWAVHRPQNSLDVTKGVWPLGQVCGWWWDIVLASPILWSVIILKPPYTQHSTDILAHHFRRSSELPLWIAIRTKDGVNDSCVFDMVIQQSAIWKMMDMRAPSKDLAQLPSVFGNVPFLEELYVSTRDSEVHLDTDALSFAPSLRRASLGPPVEISKRPLSASLLTHFQGTFRHLADIRYITQIQTLIELRVRVHDEQDRPLDSGNPSLRPVRMEQLRFFQVNDVRILGALTAPSLKRLNYFPDFVSNEDGIYPEVVQKIHHLKAVTASLSYLVVFYEEGHPASPLDRLTVRETLPAMNRLCLCIDPDVGWERRDGKTLIDIVRRRFHEERAAVLNVARLTSLRIDCADDSEVIDQLKSEGLDALEAEARLGRRFGIARYIATQVQAVVVGRKDLSQLALSYTSELGSCKIQNVSSQFTWIALRHAVATKLFSGKAYGEQSRTKLLKRMWSDKSSQVLCPRCKPQKRRRENPKPERRGRETAKDHVSQHSSTKVEGQGYTARREITDERPAPFPEQKPNPDGRHSVKAGARRTEGIHSKLDNLVNKFVHDIFDSFVLPDFLPSDSDFITKKSAAEDPFELEMLQNSGQISSG